MSDPVRRSLSPTRSALHKRQGSGGRTDDGPSAQLLADIDRAAKAQKVGVKKTKGKKDQRAEIEALIHDFEVPSIGDGAHVHGSKGIWSNKA